MIPPNRRSTSRWHTPKCFSPGELDAPPTTHPGKRSGSKCEGMNFPTLELLWTQPYNPWMKLRLDLLEHLTTEDAVREAQATVHRFKPEPFFSKTGTGSLSSASTKVRAQEVRRSMALARKLEQRAKKAGG